LEDSKEGRGQGASTINNNIGGGVPVLLRLGRHFSRALAWLMATV
jgi:hypothetical protein